MTERKIINTENAPKAVGPYSQAVLVGDTLYISGQLGINPLTGRLVEGTTAEQAKQALSNVRVILNAAGMDLSNVVQVQVFLTDIADFAAVNQVYASFFGKDFPARAAIQVSALPVAAKVEIVATAIK